MITHIQPAHFQAWLAAQEDSVTVLDVREAWELGTASVKADGFTLKHIPMNDVPARLAELNHDAPIACLCHHGARSGRVADFLAQNGFTNVSNITGGIAAWAQSVDPSIPQY
ncbi:MAG: rhodanese-like domain-containing protein [Cytophagales bacterium]|nr:rhodanese-like domain-containing protein [Cytophagales bacterium]